MAPALTLPLAGNVLRPLHRVILPKIGMNRNFPTFMIPVPPAIGGLDLKSLELEQGLSSLSTLAGLWLSSTPSSILLKTSLELLQLEVGSKLFVLHTNFKKYSCLAMDCWLTSIWEFCDKHEIFSNFPGLITSSATTANDKAIMDLAIEFSVFSKFTLHQINLVRIHLEVYFYQT